MIVRKTYSNTCTNKSSVTLHDTHEGHDYRMALVATLDVEVIQGVPVPHAIIIDAIQIDGFTSFNTTLLGTSNKA